MSSNNFFKSNLMELHNIVQSSMIVYPKEVIIAALRDFFSKDDYYHYSKDQWGFPNTTDHTDLPVGSDMPTQHNENGANQEGLSTRIFIGENYRRNGIFYPAILVKNGGSRYVPISINRNKDGVQYKDIIYEDGYGNQTIVHRPVSFVTSGIWEGSIIIDVLSRSLRARDDIIELLGIFFAEINVDTMYDIGLVIKPPTISSPTETDDRNDKLFRQTITLEIRTEWRREIPVSNIVEAILFTATFEDLGNPSASVDSDFTVKTEVSLTDTILNM